MNPRTLAMLIGVGRVAFGGALLLRPEVVAGGWIGPDASRPGTKVAVRATGARDAILGFGVLLAARRGAPLRGWVEAGMACDVADCAIAIAAFRDLPPFGRFVTLAMAGGSAYVSSRVAATVDAAQGDD